MNASNLELRHRKLLHQLLVAAAFVTYLYDPDDIVWRFVKNSSASHQWERALFLAASIAIFAGAVLCTWSRAHRKAESNSSIAPGSQVDGTQALGEILYAVGLASLFPLSGFLILVIGETLRVVRLVSPTADSVRSDHLFQGPRNPDFSPDAREKQRSDAWGTAFRITAYNPEMGLPQQWKSTHGCATAPWWLPPATAPPAPLPLGLPSRPPGRGPHRLARAQHSGLEHLRPHRLEDRARSFRPRLLLNPPRSRQSGRNRRLHNHAAALLEGPRHRLAALAMEAHELLCFTRLT
jgi:hypothetical protein